MAYTQPTPATLKIRYPAFVEVDDATVEYWLEDARLTVTDAWDEVDRARAEMALAAHNMVRQGLGTGSVGVGEMAGVTDFKSASFSVSFDADAVKAASAGGYGSTPYGAEFALYLRRYAGGPSLVGCVEIRSCC